MFVNSVRAAPRRLMPGPTMAAAVDVYLDRAAGKRVRAFAETLHDFEAAPLAQGLRDQQNFILRQRFASRFRPAATDARKTPSVNGASRGVWRAEARGAPPAAISNNSADDSGDGPDANDAD